MKKLKVEELGRIDVAAYRKSPKLPVCLLLDNVRSLHNVGSVFRTADAFRIEKLWLTGITGAPPHRDIHKTALGATESVEWEHVKDPVAVIQRLRDLRYQIIIVEHTAESIHLDQFAIEPAIRYCLVLGNEVRGVSELLVTLADAAIEVPQSGTKHSLNVSVCAGIVAWEFFRKLSAGAARHAGSPD